MKKLLALFLIFPIFISAEDIEYPIELTCESGPWIHHISITSSDNAWIKKVSGPKDPFLLLRDGEKYSLKNIVITESTIELKTGFGLGAKWIINRYSGGIQLANLNSGVRGRCFRGFKEYKETKI